MNALLKTSWNCVTLSGTHGQRSLQNQSNFCKFMPQRAQVCPEAKGGTTWCLFYYIILLYCDFIYCTCEIYQKTDLHEKQKTTVQTSEGCTASQKMIKIAKCNIQIAQATSF